MRCLLVENEIADGIPAIRSYEQQIIRFSDFAKKTARAAGNPIVFALAAGVIVLWLITGPLFGFSDTWHLIINTGTTIVTFLMVFLIQNTQNRDSEAMHIKSEELIRAVEGANNALLNLEDLGEKELDSIRADYVKLAEAARQPLIKENKSSGNS